MRLSSICQKAEVVFQCGSYHTPVGYLVKIHSKMLKNKLSPAGAAATYAGAAATYVGAAATYVGAAATYVGWVAGLIGNKTNLSPARASLLGLSLAIVNK